MSANRKVNPTEQNPLFPPNPIHRNVDGGSFSVPSSQRFYASNNSFVNSSGSTTVIKPGDVISIGRIQYVNEFNQLVRLNSITYSWEDENGNEICDDPNLSVNVTDVGKTPRLKVNATDTAGNVMEELTVDLAIAVTNPSSLTAHRFDQRATQMFWDFSTLSVTGSLYEDGGSVYRKINSTTGRVNEFIVAYSETGGVTQHSSGDYAVFTSNTRLFIGDVIGKRIGWDFVADFKHNVTGDMMIFSNMYNDAGNTKYTGNHPGVAATTNNIYFGSVSSANIRNTGVNTFIPSERCVFNARHGGLNEQWAKRARSEGTSAIYSAFDPPQSPPSGHTETITGTQFVATLNLEDDIGTSDEAFDDITTIGLFSSDVYFFSITKPYAASHFTDAESLAYYDQTLSAAGIS